ncbi:MAG: SET domain-containing protein [bacterium]|nr:SET domain-containing protein [bacterium]
MFLIRNIKVKGTIKKGRGVFATSDIKAGTVIGDYLGTILPEKEDDLSRGLYSMAWGGDDDTIILANPDKNGIHLINHSCVPNTWMHPYNGRTVYFALRKIFKDEELTINYLIGEPDEDCKPCDDVCHCGDIFCHGTQHSSEYLVDAHEKYERRIIKKQHIPRRPKSGTQLKKLSRYPKSISDDPVFVLFSNRKKSPVKIENDEFPPIKTLRCLIRETGRSLEFSKIGLTVVGIREGHAIVKT